jgi:hypothetical protein
MRECDVDIREESGGEMGDVSERNRKAGHVLRCVLWGSKKKKGSV